MYQIYEWCCFGLSVEDFWLSCNCYFDCILIDLACILQQHNESKYLETA